METKQMKPLAEQVFLGEIALQIKIAQCAAKRLPSTPSKFDTIEVWCSIQTILSAAANVSKILWPRKVYNARGEHLRKLLKICDNNILSDRKFRNHFEHYDERIETWFEGQASVVYTDQIISPFRPNWGDNPPNQHRAYNPLKHTVTFRGDSIDLAAVLNGLKEILIKCRGFVLTDW